MCVFVHSSLHLYFACMRRPIIFEAMAFRVLEDGLAREPDLSMAARVLEDDVAWIPFMLAEDQSHPHSQANISCMFQSRRCAHFQSL